jgi:hypothetical protein
MTLPDPPLTVEGLARRWGMSKGAVYDRIKAGHIKVFKIAGMGKWLISASEVARCESGGDTMSVSTNSDSSTARPSSSGGRRGKGTVSASVSEQNRKAELRLIASPDGEPR